MTGGIDAAGDFATGSLIARAVEPGAGEHAVDHPGGQAGGLCLNCGTRLIGEHCHACGQAAHVHRTVGAIGHDIAHGVFHFEGKIWHTLPMLVFHPGTLTRRYIAGERARFVSPLALFLFTVFLTFASYNLLLSGDTAKGLVDGLAGAQVGVENSRNAMTVRLARLERQRAEAAAAGAPVADLDRRLAETRGELQGLSRIQQRITSERGGSEIAVGWPWLDHGIAKARANPSLVAYKVQSSGYKYSWALILISVPLVALLFLWRRGFTLYDHAVFVTYSISFMSLLAVVLELWSAMNLWGDGFWLLLMLVPPVHMFVQLRGAYSLRRRSALWRTIMLLWFAATALTMFVLVLIAMGISG